MDHVRATYLSFYMFLSFLSQLINIYVSSFSPAMLAAKTVNFELFSTFPFFASALILPRTDHFKLLVCISVRGSWSISFHFFPFQVTYCSSRWFAILGPFPAATIDFSHPFPTYLESVPPQKFLQLSAHFQIAHHICTVSEKNRKILAKLYQTLAIQ